MLLNRTKRVLGFWGGMFWPDRLSDDRPTRRCDLLDAKTALRILRSKNGESLILNGYSSLNEEAAAVLGGHRGPIHLNDLRHLCAGAAQILAERHVGFLSLDRLEVLDNATAAALARHVGDLSLRRLTALSESPEHVSLASSLSKQSGQLNLDGICTLSDQAAAALASHEGTICLKRLVELHDTPGHIALATKLAQNKGTLYLGGLKRLTAASTAALAKHQGGLNLDGLKEMQDSIAEMLAAHEGWISLNGLDHLTESAATSLAKLRGGLSMEGLDSLSSGAAKALESHRGEWLALNGLSLVCDKVAESLGNRQGGWLSLNGMTNLTDNVASNISRFDGLLVLNGIKTLSNSSIRHLCKHSGGLSLDGLNEISKSALKSLLTQGVK